VTARLVLVWLLVFRLFTTVDDLDHWVQAQVQQGRQPWMEPIMRGASGIGRPSIVLGSLFVAAVVTGGPGLATARTVLLALAPTNLVVEGLKRVTQRARPDGRTQRKNASFPSSHAANAFAIACALTQFRPRWRIPCFVIAGLIAWSRVYLNRHYISDIVVGSAIGAGFGIWAARWSAGKGRRWIGHRLGRSADPATGAGARAADDAPVGL
jgi:membrane-associated phospholipid phosphatase